MGDEHVGVCGGWVGDWAGVVLEIWGEGEGVESVCGGGLRSLRGGVIKFRLYSFR